MNEERAKRGLKAIFSADVKGYSRLMGEDELGTVNRIKEYRQVIASHLERCNGCLVDSPGDNILAEFTSVVDAVECAVDVQKELKGRNESLPPDKKMEFRIGVNLGDVIEDGNRIYGNGVNVAARIEGLAEPGGICISRTAYDQIGKKLPYGYVYLGEHSVKNIVKPVRIYRVLIEPEAAGKVIGEKRFLGRVSHRTAKVTAVVIVIVVAGLIGWNIYLHQTRKVEAASLDRMAYPLPDKPSIAVLAFDNLSGDPDQEFISDGLSEEIITGLSTIPELFVVARNSSFVYKGKPVKVQQVSEELGVRYVLEGSVRRQGDRIRVTAQLIDAVKGYHIWSENYDRELEDILVLQSDIMKNIVFEMQVKLIHGEQLRTWWKNIAPEKIDFEFWQTMRLLIYNSMKGTPEGYERAKQLANDLLEKWPDETFSNFQTATFHFRDAMTGRSKSPADSIKLAWEYAQKTLQMDPTFGATRIVTGGIYQLQQRHDLAVAELEKWVALEPNGSEAHHWLGLFYHYSGRYDDAIREFEYAIRLNPKPPAHYYSRLAAPYFNKILYDEPTNLDKAIELCLKAMKINPNDSMAHLLLTMIYSYQKNMEEAHAHAKAVLQGTPNFSCKFLANTWQFKDKELLIPTLELLRKAGIPEG